MNLFSTFASLRKTVASIGLVTLVAGMFATGVATAATANIFTDVPAGAWFEQYVNGLADAGVLDSTKDMYRPGDLVNRAEMAKFAFEVSGLPLEKASAAPFKDVPMGQWYTDYVYTLSKNGIVSGDKLNGVPTGWFRPSDALNRAEASKMLVNSAQMAEDLSGAPHFPDVVSSAWYYNFVETLFNNGVIAGYPDGTFGPAKNINRAEVAKMVYLSMNPVSAGFTLDSAAAASSTTVELIYSMNVDDATAKTVANYKIEDSIGTPLVVSAVAKTAPDTVLLTTATQTSGKVYYVTATNVKSAAGEALANTDSVSFLGFGADVSGGNLAVSLSSTTPVAGSVPSGATGVVFTCWDFTGGASASVVRSLQVHRVGPGSQTAFSNVYLYSGDQRLTTGRSINSETQVVEFNNVNVPVTAGAKVKLCAVADLALVGASGGVHAFELANAAAVTSNSSSMTGSFPLRGADQLITTATVGTTTVTKNGSLDELTIGQKDARIAQFQVQADGSEDQMLNRVALYISGAISTSEVTNLRLYSTDSNTLLATTDSVGSKSLATFSLATPFKISRGNNKVFYVLADVGGRDGDDIKVYLDTPTDLYVTGVTYGYGTRILSTTATGGSYDGSAVTSNFSRVTIKGGVFNVAFTGPTSGDLASGQKQAKCLTMTISNNGDTDIELRDWPLTLSVVSALVPGANGLVDTVAAPAVANYSLIKLAKLNDDGSVAGALLGPTELSTTPGDASQVLTLGGTTTISAKTSIKAGIVLDVRSGAQAANDQIRCTIGNLTAGPNTVKNTVQNKQLDSNSITPASDIVGNIFTIKQGALNVALSSTPSSQTYTRGSANVALGGFSFTAGSSLDQTIKSLTIAGQVDANNDGTYSAAGVGSEALDGTSILSNIVDSGVALYDGATMVSELKNINTLTGQVVFNNLNINVAKSSTKNLVLRGNISNSAPFGVLPDRVKFSIAIGTDVIAIDQNGQNVDSASIITASANQTAVAVSTVFMTITSSGTGTVASSSTDSAKVVAGISSPGYPTEADFIVAGKWSFTSVNDNPVLKDLDFLVLNGSPAAVSRVKLYSDSACATQIGSVDGYTPTPNGTVQVRDLNQVLSSSSTFTLCAKMAPGLVDLGGAEPISGSNAGLALLSVSKVSSGSGLNVAPRYTGSAIGIGTFLTTNIDSVCTIFAAGVAPNCNAIANPLLVAAAVGDVLQIDGEMMLVTIAGANPTVIRGFANTVAASHTAGSDVRLSTVATRAAAAIDVKVGDVYTNDGIHYMLCVNPAAAGVLTTCDNVLDVKLLKQGLNSANPVSAFAAAAVASTRFPLHGALSSLYRVVPVVAYTGPTTSSVLATDVDLFNFSLTSQGSANLAPTSITINYSGSGVFTLPANACTLNDGSTPFGPSTNTLGASGTIVFSFLNGAIPAGYNFTGTKTYLVKCTGMGVPAGAGNTLTASMQRASDPIQWFDGVTAVTGVGNMLLTADVGPKQFAK